MSEVTLERSAQLIPDKQSALVYDFAPTKLQTRVCTLQCIVRFTSYVKSPARQDPASCLIDSGSPILGRKASGGEELYLHGTMPLCRVYRVSCSWQQERVFVGT